MYKIALNFYLFFIKLIRFVLNYNIKKVMKHDITSFKFHVISLLSVYNVQEMIYLKVPWWTYDSITFLKAFLNNKKKLDAFEYGPGASSFWLKQFCKSITFVEHDEDFYKFFKGLIKNEKKISGRLILPSQNYNGKYLSKKEGFNGYGFESYVKSIADVGKKFDIIVIDGRCRVLAFEYSKKYLKTGGIIIFDNSNRHRYRSIFEKEKKYKRFFGIVPKLLIKDETKIFLKNKNA